MSLHRIRLSLRVAPIAASLLVLGGCSIPSATPAKSAIPIRYFVPPAPRPVQVPHPISEPPPFNLYAKELPLLLADANPVPQRTLESQLRLKRANTLFDAASTLFVQGQQEEARAAFDEALEVLASAPSSLPERPQLVTRSEQMVEAIHRLEVEATGQATADQEPVFDHTPLEDIVDMTFPLEPGLKGKVREQVLVTASQLPLDISDPVLSFINFFSSPRGQRVLVYGFQRSGRYAPMIRRILDEEGLPQELIYLAQAESGFLPRAVSRMRAAGMWQFMASRGNEYGLLQTSTTDDRLDPEKATRAAARHLRDLFAQFGDWYLAIAAYNCGPYTVERAIQRTGYADFWELYKRNVIPRETANYLPIILAMTIMAKNPKDYGIDQIQLDPSLEFDTIRLTAPTHLALVADLADKPLQSIRELNPAVLKLVAPEGYPVHVPKGAGGTLLAALDQVPAARRASWRVHRVTPSQTVAAIARQYNTTEKSIAEANGGAAIEAEEGDVLLIPVSYPGPAPAPSQAVRKRTAASVTSKPVAKPATTASAAGKKVTAGQTAATRAKAPARQPPPAKPAVGPVASARVPSGPRL